MADNRHHVTASITAENTGTDWLQLRGGYNFFDISISGSFAATVTVQRKRRAEADASARDIETYLSGVEKPGAMQGQWDVRLFVKTSDFTSGTVVLELGV